MRRLLAFALTVWAFGAQAQVSPGTLPFAPLPLTTDDCVKALNAFQGVDAGAPCGVGSVSAGLINQLAYFAVAGNTLSGLATANNGVLVTSGGGVPSISSTLPSGLAIPSPTFSGTVTFPDAATWAATGLSIGGTYTTASTPIISVSPIFNYTSTGTVNLVNTNFIMTPTGASSSAANGANVATTYYNSAVNITTGVSAQFGVVTDSSYTGTVATGAALSIAAPSVGGSNPITTYNGIWFRNGITNGNGITTGTVNNNGINLGTNTAAAGAGGAVNNTQILVNLPSGSSAGTTSKGIWITGNGGAASTKFALYSDSTALSQIGGELDVGSNSTDFAKLTGGASGATITTNAGTLTITSGGGTTLALGDTAPTMANLASSAAALDALCWNASGGVITHNGAGALCSASLEELKDRLASIAPSDARGLILGLDPFWGKFKDDVKTTSDHRVSPMLGAHAVAALDPRLAEYDADGNLHGVRYVNLTAVLAAAYKAHDADIAELRSQVADLRAQQANDNRPLRKASAQ